MKRWVGPGVVADNLLNTVVHWKSSPLRRPSAHNLGHVNIRRPPWRDSLYDTAIDRTPKNINFAPKSS
jgi:hypothetical protein